MNPSSILVDASVTDPAGRPVAQARVYVVDAPVALPDVAMLTGADGTFRLALPAPGVYRIGISADGHMQQTATVVAAPGPPIALQVTLPPGQDG
jgi:hypothetical protein